MGISGYFCSTDQDIGISLFDGFKSGESHINWGSWHVCFLISTSHKKKLLTFVYEMLKLFINFAMVKLYSRDLMQFQVSFSHKIKNIRFFFYILNATNTICFWF
jgi:hypothetical protein